MKKLNISHRLQVARKKLGLNQIEIARDLSIQQKTISEIENGKILNIPNTYIYYFYKKGISLDWIYEEKGAMLIQDSQKDAQNNKGPSLENLFDNVQSKTIKLSEKELKSLEGESSLENIGLYERLVESKDETIKSLLAYISSQENNMEFVKELIAKNV